MTAFTEDKIQEAAEGLKSLKPSYGHLTWSVDLDHNNLVFEGEDVPENLRVKIREDTHSAAAKVEISWRPPLAMDDSPAEILIKLIETIFDGEKACACQSYEARLRTLHEGFSANRDALAETGSGDSEAGMAMAWAEAVSFLENAFPELWAKDEGPPAEWGDDPPVWGTK